MILGPADAGIDREILNRLHIKGNANDPGNLFLEALNNVARGELTLILGFEIDQKSAAVQGWVFAVDPNERADVFDRRIPQDGFRELALEAGHRPEGHILRGFRNRHDHAGVLHREKAFGNHDIERDGQAKRGDRDKKRQRLMRQHDIERSPILFDQAVERALRHEIETIAADSGTMPDQPRAEHRHKCQRNDGRNDNRDGQRDREFMEQTADHLPHKIAE